MNLELNPGNVKSATKGIKSSDLWQVPYDDLYIPPGFNIRENGEKRREHINNLKALIKANGYDRTKSLAGYVVLVDGRDRVAVTDGENRYIAVGELRSEGMDIETLPVITAPRGTSMEDVTISLATSNSGLALTPYEMGTLCKRMIGFGWDEAAIAAKLNFTPTYIADLLFLHSCPKAVRELVRTDKVSAGVAIDVARKHGAKAAEVLGQAVEKATAGGKKKASAKHLAPEWKSEVKKNGAKLYEAVMWVKEDAGWEKLSVATRNHLLQLIGSLPPEPIKPAT